MNILLHSPYDQVFTLPLRMLQHSSDLILKGIQSLLKAKLYKTCYER